MRLFLLTLLTMAAFAANSILNRAALSTSEIGPGAFAALRVASGAAMLMLLLMWRDRKVWVLGRPKIAAVLALSAYMLGFSYAYVVLDAGLGALILFGGVQVTMFLGAVAGQEAVPAPRWIGAGLAFGGLLLLFWPAGAQAPPLVHAALMIVAALGWGIYSLIGRGVDDPLLATGANFVFALPLIVLAVALWPGQGPITPLGVALAIVSGALTSGLGYALWYAILPRLGAAVAAVAQLSVPVIALAAGALFLAETVTMRSVLAAALVLGGVALGVVPVPRRLWARFDKRAARD